MAVNHYVVTPGDTWASIAQKLSPVGVTETQLILFASSLAMQNGMLTTGSLVPGRVLHVEDTTIPSLTPVTAAPPSPPRALNATAGNNQVVLTWSTPESNGGAPIIDYEILRGSTVINDGIGAGLTFTDASVSNETQYSYTVRAKNSAGTSPPSNIVTVTPAAPEPPKPPSSFVINETFNTSSTAVFTILRGNLTVSNGVLRASAANTEVDAYHNTVLSSSNHEVSAKFIIGSGLQANSWFAINARMAPTGLTYYSVETDQSRNTLVLLRVSNGSYTPLGSWTPTNWAASSSHTVRLSCNGSSIKVFADEVEVISVTDTGISDGTRVGVHCNVADVNHYAWDDFTANVLTVSPPQPPVSPAPAGDFYTKNGFIGRDGKRFVPLGVNGVAIADTIPPGDWWNDYGMGNMNGKAKQYRSFGFNFLRINQSRDFNVRPEQDWVQGTFNVIDTYTAEGVVCMPAYHAQGPGTNPTPAQLDANTDFQNYWNGIINRYKNNPMVWANPLNEPIGTEWHMWETVGNYQYDMMRSRGWTGMIVIDLPQWAQGINVGTQRMAAFMQGKTKCALGFHNYDMGDQTAAVQAAQAAGVPIIIGEYGETMTGGNRSSAVWVAENAQRLGIGAVAWWGAGVRDSMYVLRNRVGATWYDVNVPLTDFGQRLFTLAANQPAQPNL